VGSACGAYTAHGEDAGGGERSGRAGRRGYNGRLRVRMEKKVYKVSVRVRLKPSVLDPQGKTVLAALRNLGFGDVHDVRVGKVIELKVEGESEDAVKGGVEQMCEHLLANPVIEEYEIEVEADD